MATTGIELSGNNEAFELAERTTFPPVINEALQDCERARDELLTMRSELEDSSGNTNSLANSYCNISLHVNGALQSSIRAIGYGASVANRLRRILSSEQRREVADDLHNMQREMVTTYAACRAANQELWVNLRPNLQQDPMLCEDRIAVQCVDAIEEQAINYTR